MAFRLEVPPGRKSMEAVQVVPTDDGVSPASEEPEFPGLASETKGLERMISFDASVCFKLLLRVNG